MIGSFLLAAQILLSGIQIGQSVRIHFICDTADAAKNTAVGRSWTSPLTMPTGCRLLFGLGLPEQAAVVVRIVEMLPVEDGRVIAVGYVFRNNTEYGYSAGEVDLFLAENRA